MQTDIAHTYIINGYEACDVLNVINNIFLVLWIYRKKVQNLLQVRHLGKINNVWHSYSPHISLTLASIFLVKTA